MADDMPGRPENPSGSDDLADAEIPPPSGRFANAVAWSYVMNAARLASTLGTAFILARLLGPEAFGTVALALIFITLVQLLLQQGMIPAIVQRQHLTWHHLDTAFWLAVAISVVLAAVSAAMSPIWAWANDAPDAKLAIWALTSTILIRGLVVVQEGLLQREMRFRELALRTTAASVVGAVVGITWAIVQPSIWALVVQQIVTVGVGAIIIWGVVPWRPRLSWRTDDARDLLGFASKSTLSGFGTFVNGRIDAVLIGMFFGPIAIGLYQLAFRLMQSAIEVTIYPISGVALSDLSRHQDDPAAAAARYRTLVGFTAAIGAPVMATIFACARPLMAIVGPDWDAAAPTLQLLCVVGIVTIVGMVNSPALQAAGRPGAQALLVWFGAIVSAITFAIAGALLTGAGVGAQVVGMATSRSIVYVIVLLPVSQAVLISRYVGVRPIEFLRVIAPPVAVSAAAAAAGVGVEYGLRTAGAPSPLTFVIVGVVTMAIAIPLLLASTPQARQAAARILHRLPEGVRPGWVERRVVGWTS